MIARHDLLPSAPFAFQRKLETSLFLEWRICVKRVLEFAIFDICVVLHEKIEHLDLSFECASLSILAQLAAAFKIYHSCPSLGLKSIFCLNPKTAFVCSMKLESFSMTNIACVPTFWVAYLAGSPIAKEQDIVSVGIGYAFFLSHQHSSPVISPEYGSVRIHSHRVFHSSSLWLHLAANIFDRTS